MSLLMAALRDKLTVCDELSAVAGIIDRPIVEYSRRQGRAEAPEAAPGVALVGRNSRSGSEPQVRNEVRAPRSAPSLICHLRRRSEARVGPLASFGNTAIGVERKSDTTDLAVTAH